MNIFSKYLSKRANSAALNEFVAHWDKLEILVITVFKSKQATGEDEEMYRLVSSWFDANYDNWQIKMRPHWQGVLAGGEIIESDPFLALLSAETAADFDGNWRAMQLLAAARETLNNLLVAEGKPAN